MDSAGIGVKYASVQSTLKHACDAGHAIPSFPAAISNNAHPQSCGVFGGNLWAAHSPTRRASLGRGRRHVRRMVPGLSVCGPGAPISEQSLLLHRLAMAHGSEPGMSAPVLGWRRASAGKGTPLETGGETAEAEAELSDKVWLVASGTSSHGRCGVRCMVARRSKPRSFPTLATSLQRILLPSFHTVHAAIFATPFSHRVTKTHPPCRLPPAPLRRSPPTFRQQPGLRPEHHPRAHARPPPDPTPTELTATGTHVGSHRAHNRGGSIDADEHCRRAGEVTDSEAPLLKKTAAMAQVLSSQASFHAPPPRRSPSSSSLLDSSYGLRRNQNSLPNLRVPSPGSSRTSSIRSTSSSNLSLNTQSEESSSEDDVLCMRKKDAPPPRKQPIASLSVEPATGAYKSALRQRSPSPSPIDGFSVDTVLTTPDLAPISEDDTAVRKEPSHHVDYLSYNWREEDIWSSWRHIVEHRSVYGERSRLENASWRTWAKSQFKLKTVSPDSLNW